MWKQTKNLINAIGYLKSDLKSQPIRLAAKTAPDYWLSFDMKELVNDALHTNQTNVAVKVCFARLYLSRIVMVENRFMIQLSKNFGESHFISVALAPIIFLVATVDFAHFCIEIMF